MRSVVGPVRGRGKALVSPFCDPIKFVVALRKRARRSSSGLREICTDTRPAPITPRKTVNPVVIRARGHGHHLDLRRLSGRGRCPDDNAPLKLKLHKFQGGDYNLRIAFPVCGKRKEFRRGDDPLRHRFHRWTNEVRPLWNRLRRSPHHLVVYVYVPRPSKGTQRQL